MRRNLLIIFLLTAISLSAAEKAPAIQSMTTMTFSPSGILFIADSIGSNIFAFDLTGEAENASQEPRTQNGFGKMLGKMMGIPADDVLVHDMAVHPKSQDIYFSVSPGRKNWDTAWKTPGELAKAVILMKMDPKGALSEVKTGGMKMTWTQVKKPISPEEQTFMKTSKRSFTVTDMVYYQDELYVAGLTNEEFASTMRIFPFPFKGEAQVTSLEIYHGAHGQFETNAPIRTFEIMPIKGEPHLVAAYLCTPIAVFKLSDIKSKKHLRGRTVAELGSGNFPIDMVRINNKAGDRVLMTNSHDRRTTFTRENLEKYTGTIEKPVRGPYGMDHRKVSGINIVQMSMLNPSHIVSLRLAPNGVLNLASEPVRK